MIKDALLKLRQQLDNAIGADTPEAYATLATSLTSVLRELGGVPPVGCVTEDQLGRVLQIVEDGWLKGLAPLAPLPGNPDQQHRLTRLLSDMLSLQELALSMSKGDLSQTAKIPGLMAGSLKALQAGLRHLTWQTRMIAKGDLSQRVEFMGEFSESFNSMVSRLAEARDQLNSHAEELARANAELQQFAYVASHDLQEPLRMISSYLQLLARRYKGKLDQDADDFIDFAVDGARRMQGLINDILQLSRLGTREKSLSTIDCEAILEEALTNLQLSIENSRAQVTHDPLPKITADGTQLVQLFQNLVGNAIKFRGQSDPLIHVSAQRNGATWLFSVRDNGIGIAQQYFDRIFGIFQRLHGRGEYPGTGIGLAICRKIVEGHGGKIWAESEPGNGATFFFTLPNGDG
jgi:signal transduction histidine kinase